MNPLLDKLQRYPFEKLQQLKSGVNPPETLAPIALSIGEPKHAPPQFVLDTFANNLQKLSQYPTTRGLDGLRQSIVEWLSRRFNLATSAIDANRHVLPVNGTREALFSVAQALVDTTASAAKVLMPNPFYQIYEGATLLAGAEPVYLNCSADNNYLPHFSEVKASVWQDCQLLYLCSPGNPTGAVLSIRQLQELIQLAEKYNFVIASDECYSELYFEESSPPPGLLQACSEMGNDDFKHCLVFHSLSKRSNLPGLRSGFVAGDADLIQTFYRYRTYHGCAMPVPAQLASIAAWQDENHVRANRDLYRHKFERVLTILDNCLKVEKPEASFYLWPETPIDDCDFTKQLFAKTHITVLPGSYLARDSAGTNPGCNRIRMALVASVEECEDAAWRLKEFCQQLRVA